MAKEAIGFIDNKIIEFEAHSEITTERFVPVMDRLDDFSEEIKNGLLKLKELSEGEDFSYFNDNVVNINKSGKWMIILVYSQRMKTLIEYKMLKNIMSAFQVEFVRVSA